MAFQFGNANTANMILSCSAGIVNTTWYQQLIKLKTNNNFKRNKKVRIYNIIIIIIIKVAIEWWLLQISLTCVYSRWSPIHVDRCLAISYQHWLYSKTLQHTSLQHKIWQVMTKIVLGFIFYTHTLPPCKWYSWAINGLWRKLCVSSMCSLP